MPPIASEDQWLVAPPQNVGLDPNKLSAHVNTQRSRRARRER